MQSAKYKIISAQIKNQDGYKAKTYGIKIVATDTDIQDISCDRKIVENLISRLGNESIELKQLMYIIEDSIV